ncbi:MAG: DUF3316 domain-containing protein [Porphyromonas sp.]|nr:DUF3316 domain-containing protein [Porphyromonas sp.]
MKHLLRNIILPTLLCSSLVAQNPLEAQRPQTTRSIHTIGIGGIVLQDLYLSPLSYGGRVFSYNHQKLSPLKPNKSLLLHYISDVETAIAHNPAKNAMFWTGSGRFAISPLWRIQLPLPFRIYAGGATDMSLGGIFSTRNGNNPANINFHLDLQSALLLSYRLPIPSCPILATLTWRASLLGSTFVTDFGESYYENFMLQDVKHGFLDGLHFSHLGKSHRQELEFALDIPLPWIMTLRIGYRLSEHDQRINFLRSSHLSNSFFFGVVKELWSTSGRDAERGKTADTIF